MSRPLAAGGRALMLLGLLLASPLPGMGQDPPPPPPPPDSIPVDTIPRPVPADTLQADTAAADTLAWGEPAEDRPVRNLTEPSTPTPAGWNTGVWIWDREALLSSRAITLLELLELIPGVVPLRGGDYGQPSSVTAFGLGPGEIRVFLNGAEMAPLDGAVLDLAQVGMTGLDNVRVERRPGELRVELTGYRFVDGQIYSLLEVGTGDLNSNLFRGTFAHPDALGGNLVLTLDRLDTEGPFRQESGLSQGVQLRYDYFLGHSSGVSLEWRQMTARRPAELWNPGQVNRRDMSIRARHTLPFDIQAGVFVHQAALSLDEERSGPGADTLVSTDARREVGTRLSWGDHGLWAMGEGRFRSGEGWPSRVVELRGGGAWPGVASLASGIRSEGWDGDSATGFHARGWTEPRFGLSLFGEFESGRRGIPIAVPIRPAEEEEDENGEGPTETIPPLEEEPFIPSFTERTGIRVGAEFRRGDVHLSGAFLSQDVDLLFPHGLGVERDRGVTQPAGNRTGFEVAGALPLSRLLNGLSLVAHAQLWNADVPDWRYLPRENWEARLRFYNLFLESGNLEVWSDLGLRSRGEMLLPLAGSSGDGLAQVPENGRWFARLQIRVLDMHVFLLWDNLTFRDENRDYPDRFLPVSRAMYGVRWTLWN